MECGSRDELWKKEVPLKKLAPNSNSYNTHFSENIFLWMLWWVLKIARRSEKISFMLWIFTSDEYLHHIILVVFPFRTLLKTPPSIIPKKWMSNAVGQYYNPGLKIKQ